MAQCISKSWQNDPDWLGVRENVERLTATPDWAEQTLRYQRHL